jgi:serine/threonine protein kinase
LIIDKKYILENESCLVENRLYTAKHIETNERVYIKVFEKNKYICDGFLPNLIDQKSFINSLGSRSILKLLDVGIDFINVVVDKSQILNINKRTNYDMFHDQNIMKGINHKEKNKIVFYLVYEYFEGVNLDILNKKKRISYQNVIKILLSVLKILQVLHLQGYYHGSLKTNSILVDKNCNVKICDFGITVSNNGSNTRSYGNIYYMSASQICIDYSDKESDFFAIGEILFELIFRMYPFGRCDDENRLLRRIDRGINWNKLEYRYFSNIDNDSEKNKKWFELYEISKKLLERGSSDRYKYAKDVIIDLMNIIY